MEILSNLDSLKTLLGVGSTAPSAAGARGSAVTAGNGIGSDHATLSSTASEMSQSVGEDGVRMQKVSSIQAALAAGTYNVPQSAVASKLVDSMLGA